MGDSCIKSKVYDAKVITLKKKKKKGVLATEVCIIYKSVNPCTCCRSVLSSYTDSY